MRERNKVAAGAFGIVFGAFGAHYFYLGNRSRGLLYLLLTLFVPLCAMIFSIMGLVEGFRFLMMTDAEFDDYIKDFKIEKKKEGMNPFLRFFVLLFGFIIAIVLYIFTIPIWFQKPEKRIKRAEKHGKGNVQFNENPNNFEKVNGKYRFVLFDIELVNGWFNIYICGQKVKSGKVKTNGINEILLYTANGNEMNLTLVGNELKTLHGIAYKKLFDNSEKQSAQQMNAPAHVESQSENEGEESQSIDGKYAANDTIIIVKDNHFEILLEGRKIKEGVVSDFSDRVEFRTYDGKLLKMTKDGKNLVTSKGTIYKKQ